jgi:glycosyl transferase family 25
MIFIWDNRRKLFLAQTDWIPKDAHIIKIEAFYPKVTVSIYSKSIFSSNRKLVALKSKHMGAGGYILSNQGAKALLLLLKNIKSYSN